MNSNINNHFSKISFFVFFIIIIILSFVITSHFILAIIGGAFLAQLLRPLLNILIAKKVPAQLSAYLILIFFVIIMIVPMFFFLQKSVLEISKLTQFVSSSNISFISITNSLKESPFFNYFISDPYSLDDQLIKVTKFAVETIQEIALNIAAKTPSMFIDTFFILFSFIIFLLNGEKIKNFISNLIPLHEYIKNNLIITSNEIFKFAFLSSFLAAIAQAMTVLSGFLILGLPNAFLAGVATFFFSFIPLVGSVPVWGAGIIYLIFYGSTSSIIIMIMIGIVASLMDNLIRALVLKSSKERLHPFIGLISVIGGIQVFGLLGVLIGPIIAALLLSMCRVWPEVMAYKAR